jgi:glycosyltransferase involved in cell wall biosynthesis
MIRIFVNALAASAGGGVTYVRNIVPYLAARQDVRTTLLLPTELRLELATHPNVNFIEDCGRKDALSRYLYEQKTLPKLIQRSRSNVLLSAGNFALRHSPVPQILLSRNALYTCSDFYHDLLRRREYRMWLDTKIKASLARLSVRIADLTIAPSHAFANELQRWTGKNVTAIHHGFDPSLFAADREGLDAQIVKKLSASGQGIRLLFVSHYNYYRNFETLIRALAKTVFQHGDSTLKLVLTCTLEPGKNPGTYHPDSAARLVNELGLRDNIIELGSVPYRQLHHLYKACDIYVTPAYCESFAHPLVEAMFSGLPIIASDIPVHREICEDAAVYFPRFSDSILSQQIMELAASSEKRQQLAAKGLLRATAFSWSDHVQDIISLTSKLTCA